MHWIKDNEWGQWWCGPETSGNSAFGPEIVTCRECLKAFIGESNKARSRLVSLINQDIERGQDIAAVPRLWMEKPE